MRALATAIISGLLLFANSAHAAEPCPHKTLADAFKASQELAREELKAPSTARFPSYQPSGNKSHAMPMGECKFSILSYVDAENVFSAMLRERYVAIMEYDADLDRWTGTLLWVSADF